MDLQQQIGEVMEDYVDRNVCEAKMGGITSSLTDIKGDTEDIMDAIKPLSALCEKVSNIDKRVSILEEKFDKLLTSMVISIIVGIIVFILTRGFGIGGG